MDRSFCPYADHGARDFTSASAHPELLVGEFAMRPRIHGRLTAHEQQSVAGWSRRIGAIVMVAFLTLGISSLLARPSEHAIVAKSPTRSADPACLAWDFQTSDAVVSFMQETKTDIDLGRLTNVIGQMRKARHSCKYGFLRLACEDYRKVLESVDADAEAARAKSIDCPGTPALFANQWVIPR